MSDRALFPTSELSTERGFEYRERPVFMCKVEWAAHLALDELKQQWREHGSGAGSDSHESAAA